jgi:hypothetical protein
MAFLLMRADVGDYDTWKSMFDSDPAGRKQAAKGHRILRSVENPNEAFLQVEFASPQDAETFREKLVASGVLDRITVLNGPTIAEVADSAVY